MKNIKYFLLFVTVLCASRWSSWEREPQRGFGPRFSNKNINEPIQQFQNYNLPQKENN